MFTLVIGGSASGKSDYAERHVMSLSGSGPRLYVATMEPFGKEARARIVRHRAMRRKRGFETIECYRAIGNADIPGNGNVLVEDLGNLVANELFGNGGLASDDNAMGEALIGDGSQTFDGRTLNQAVAEGGGKPEPVWCALSERMAMELNSLRIRCAHLTLVTNEVFSGGQDYAGDTLTYLRCLARLNTLLARRADSVVEVVCGLASFLKQGPGRTCDNPCAKERVLRQLLADSVAEGVTTPGRTVFSRPNTTDCGRIKEVLRGRKGMIFVTGPMFSGKQAYIMEALGWDEAAFAAYGVRDVQDLAARTPEDKLEVLADALAGKRVVIATEVGGGVVPLDAGQRLGRERAGRLACLLAARADTVLRVSCGLPQRLK